MVCTVVYCCVERKVQICTCSAEISFKRFFFYLKILKTIYVVCVCTCMYTHTYVQYDESFVSCGTGTRDLNLTLKTYLASADNTKLWRR